MITWAAGRAQEIATTEGNILTFLAVGTLALGAAIAGDWRWERRQLAGTKSIVGMDMRRYFYKALPGRRVVEIYLPTGRIALHRVTAAAAKDPRQLADEVLTIVNDLYQGG